MNEYQIIKLPTAADLLSYQNNTTFKYWVLVIFKSFNRIESIDFFSDNNSKLTVNKILPPFLEYSETVSLKDGETINTRENTFDFRDPANLALIDQDYNVFWCAEGREKELEELIKIERSKNLEK